MVLPRVFLGLSTPLFDHPSYDSPSCMDILHIYPKCLKWNSDIFSTIGATLTFSSMFYFFVISCQLWLLTEDKHPLQQNCNSWYPPAPKGNLQITNSISFNGEEGKYMNTYKKAKTELEPLKTSHRNRRYTQALTCPKGHKQA
jgi:hypothetical protein